MPCILAWINTIKKERKYTFYICVWWGKIFCCNSCLSKIFNTLSECNVILPPQLTCSIQMSIHFNSWKEQKTLKYVNIYMEGESKFFLSWENGEREAENCIVFLQSSLQWCNVWWVFFCLLLLPIVSSGDQRKRGK